MITVLLSRRAEREIRSVPSKNRKRIFAAMEQLESTFSGTVRHQKDEGIQRELSDKDRGWRIVYRVDFQGDRIFIGGMLRRSQAYKQIVTGLQDLNE